MQIENLEQAITTLIEKAERGSAVEAQQYAQAILTLCQARSVISDS